MHCLSLLNISLGFAFRSMLFQKLKRWRELIWQNQFLARGTSEPFGGFLWLRGCLAELLCKPDYETPLLSTSGAGQTHDHAPRLSKDRFRG
jgi:hypothetical protein